LESAGFKGPATSGGLGYSDATLKSETGLYSIVMKSVNGNGAACTGNGANPCTSYTLFAAPVTGKGQEADEKCAEFRISSTGAKAARTKDEAGFANAASRDECWK